MGTLEGIFGGKKSEIRFKHPEYKIERLEETSGLFDENIERLKKLEPSSFEHLKLMSRQLGRLQFAIEDVIKELQIVFEEIKNTESILSSMITFEQQLQQNILLFNKYLDEVKGKTDVEFYKIFIEFIESMKFTFNALQKEKTNTLYLERLVRSKFEKLFNNIQSLEMNKLSDFKNHIADLQTGISELMEAEELYFNKIKEFESIKYKMINTLKRVGINI